MSAISDFPGELAIVPRGNRWVLLIHGPGVDGEVSTRRRSDLDGIVNAYAAFRRDQEQEGSAFTRLYFPAAATVAAVAHLSHPGRPGILCCAGVDTGELAGTRSSEEREFAAALPLHAECARLARVIGDGQ